MALWKNTQHAFVAGQLDSLVMGRQDMDKYFKGATTIKNFLVKRQGCISKRRGTDLTADLQNLLGTKHDGTPIVPRKMRIVPVTNGDDGRYCILSNGVCFVANRDGILTSDRNRIRRVNPYEAVDADGNAVVSSANDKRVNRETPVDLIHRVGSGNYTVTRHTSLQNAFNAVQDGDIVRLHDNLLITSQQNISATSAKTVTFDLNGYKMTCQGAGLWIGQNITMHVTTTRKGAQVVVTGSGNPIAFYARSGTYNVKMGNLIFDGDIEYLLYTGYGGIVNTNNVDNVTINRGTFKIANDSGGYLISCLNSNTTINGGKFLCESETSSVTQLIWISTDNTGQAGVEFGFTVNGGIFESASHAEGTITDKPTSLIATNKLWTMNGGRFKAYNPWFYFGGVRKRTDSFWFASGPHIVRGSFYHNALTMLPEWADAALINAAEDGSVMNDNLPDADGYYGIKVDGEGDYRYDGFSSDAIPFRIAIPYEDDDLADLCIRQSGDTLFIAHRSYPPAKIYFDEYGYANFEELEFDNTSVYPPVIDSAVKIGFDPVATTYPAGYDNNLLAQAESIGVVTEAGINSNGSSGSDGSYNNATTYNATVVDKNSLTGVKTTHMLVKSVTSSCSFEVDSTFTDGVKTGESRRAVTTSGTAQNNAKAASVMVMRTVRYCCTYVKDGKESRPSIPVAVDYDMPWPNNAVVNITVSKGSNRDEPDYYNIYKDNGNGYGLIGTTGMDQQTGGINGFADTYPLFIPDNSKANPTLVCAADYEENHGWANGDILRKLISTGRDQFGSSPSADVCLINTASNSSGGIVFDFSKSGGARFNKIKVMLDGRIYDKDSRRSYLIVSTCRVTCTITYNKADGTTGTASRTQTDAHNHAWNGISGGMMQGIYSDWVGLPSRTFYAPNGDAVIGWLYGEGDCAEDFNSHLRYVEFDFYEAFAAIDGFKNVNSVKFTFDTSVYSYWTNNQQGCIHAIHFMNRGANATSGMFQDDYVIPDMTVTPPADEKDPHFSSVDEYPGSVGIYQQRLCFASTKSSPSTLWMSRVADIYNFTPHDSIREDDAMELTLAATEFPNLNHLICGRDLMLFGDGGEWLVAPVQGNTLTYKTASAKLQSMIGSERTLNPLQLADETLFAERGGTCLRSINYNYSSDSYQSMDLSVLSQSIFRANPIVSMAYKQHPDSIVECVLKDGKIATLVYMKEQEVMAWSVQELAGGWKAREIVTPKCIVNGTTEMMLLVERNGVYQLWKVRDDDDTPTAAKQVILDGLHVENHGTAATGETVVALGDGTYAHGLSIQSEFVSVHPEPEKGATAQMEIKNATEAEIRVVDATTFKVKPFNIDTGWREVPLPPTQSGTAVALREADVKKTLTGTNNRDGRIHVVHEQPWPLTILSISSTYQVEYENDGGKGGQQQ